MQSFASLSKDVLGHIDPDLAKAARAAKIQRAFAEAILAVCESPDAARYMLDHIQGVYILRDDAPQKGAKQPPIVLRIYSDDSVVRAELDARQEWIRLHLARLDITYDAMKIYASKFGMRQRRPFANLGPVGQGKTATPAQDIERHNLTPKEIEELASRILSPTTAAAMTTALEATAAETAFPSNAEKNGGRSQAVQTAKSKREEADRLETLKRALCLTFGENAEEVLNRINAATLSPLPGKRDNEHQSKQRYRCTLYTTDERLKQIVTAYDGGIRDNAWRLGLTIAGRIRVTSAPRPLAKAQAFPPLAPPEVIDSF